MKNFFETENIEFWAGLDYLDLCLLGETGTGKTYFAERIHELSPRAGKPFVAVNCAELTPSLIEAELFGAEKGAYTGALATKIGKFEAAQGGTLFLDEIGELPENLQAKLLKVVEAKTVTRVGGIRTRKLDVRIIYATHRGLDVFRDDFRFRVARQTIHVPPLRMRRGEIADLAAAFFADFAEKSGRKLVVDDEALRMMEKLEWPGNVRELRAFVERVSVAAVFEASKSADARGAAGRAVRIGAPLAASLARDLADEYSVNAAFAGGGTRALRIEDFPDGASMGKVIGRIEEDFICQALRAGGNNKTRAARLLGISRGGLIKKMKRVALL